MNHNLVGYGYSWTTILSDWTPQLKGDSLTVAHVMRVSTHRGGLGRLHPSYGKDEFRLEGSRDDAPILCAEGRVHQFCLLFFFSGHERIFPFEMVLRGEYKGNLKYREVPLVEILPPPVSFDRSLALSAFHVARNEGLGPQVDPVLVDAVIEGVSL